MNTYTSPSFAQIVAAERIPNRREPVSLGRPPKASRRKGVIADHGSTHMGFTGAVRSVARAVAGFSM